MQSVNEGFENFVNEVRAYRAHVQNMRSVLLTIDLKGAFPSLDEYVAGYGITAARASLIGNDAIVTHLRPVVRGIEVAGAVLDQLERVVITDQVANGVAVRQAVLFWLLGSGVDIT